MRFDEYNQIRLDFGPMKSGHMDPRIQKPIYPFRKKNLINQTIDMDQMALRSLVKKKSTYFTQIRDPFPASLTLNIATPILHPLPLASHQGSFA